MSSYPCTPGCAVWASSVQGVRALIRGEMPDVPPLGCLQTFRSGAPAQLGGVSCSPGLPPPGNQPADFRRQRLEPLPVGVAQRSGRSTLSVPNRWGHLLAELGPNRPRRRIRPRSSEPNRCRGGLGAETGRRRPSDAPRTGHRGDPRAFRAGSPVRQNRSLAAKAGHQRFDKRTSRSRCREDKRQKRTRGPSPPRQSSSGNIGRRMWRKVKRAGLMAVRPGVSTSMTRPAIGP